MLRILKTLVLSTATLALVAGCGSDDNDHRSRSSRDYDRLDNDTASGVYRSDPVPGYNARQARNAQREQERRYDDR